MATIRKGGPQWWDRDVDDQGNPIRADVRQAAHELWPECCARMRATLDDIADAPELMESSVAHVSRHLNRAGAPLFSPNAKSLVGLHFCQELRRRAGKLRRIQPVGLDTELEGCAPASDWVEGVNRRLDFEKLSVYLSDRSSIIVVMRHLGHDWREIGEKLGIAISTALNYFRKNLREARARLNGGDKHP